MTRTPSEDRVWLMASSTTAVGTFSPKKTTVGFLRNGEGRQQRGVAQYETWTSKTKKNRTGNERQHCGGGGTTMPTWQAVHEGTQNWEWSWKGTFASPSGRMPPASSADAEDEAKKAAETGTLHTSSPGVRLPVALEWRGAASLRRRRRRSGWYLLGATGAGVPAITGEDAAAFASGSQSGLAASRRAWK